MIRRIIQFYVDGFRQMTVGRSLWAIVLIKLFILFAVLRVFFFQPVLRGTEAEKTEQARTHLVTTLKN